MLPNDQCPMTSAQCPMPPPIMPNPTTTTTTSSSSTFRGVRKRRWGSWVAEIREPRTRSRIWLGSYPSASAAARAFDAASFCLRGPSARLNLPHLLLNLPLSLLPPPTASSSSSSRLSPNSIRRVAHAHATSTLAKPRLAPPPPPSPHDSPPASSSDLHTLIPPAPTPLHLPLIPPPSSSSSSSSSSSHRFSSVTLSADPPPSNVRPHEIPPRFVAAAPAVPFEDPPLHPVPGSCISPSGMRSRELTRPKERTMARVEFGYGPADSIQNANSSGNSLNNRIHGSDREFCTPSMSHEWVDPTKKWSKPQVQSSSRLLINQETPDDPPQSRINPFRSSPLIDEHSNNPSDESQLTDSSATHTSEDNEDSLRFCDAMRASPQNPGIRPKKSSTETRKCRQTATISARRKLSMADVRCTGGGGSSDTTGSRGLHVDDMARYDWLARASLEISPSPTLEQIMAAMAPDLPRHPGHEGSTPCDFADVAPSESLSLWNY